MNEVESENSLRISIVTVCYNEETRIENTIRSVLYQTADNIEYIICDGNSTDTTVKKAESYIPLFEERKIKYVVNSQKDRGIYDAMNHGIDLATGDYIIFLNAGDVFHNDTVISDMNEIMKSNRDIDIFYGNVWGITRTIFNICKGDYDRLEQTSSICHQSVFAKTELMKQHRFDLSYMIAADYDFLLSQKMQGKSFFNTNLVVADYLQDGISSRNIMKSMDDIDEVKRKYSLNVEQRNPMSVYFSMLKTAIKQKLPLSVFNCFYLSIKKRSQYISFWNNDLVK